MPGVEVVDLDNGMRVLVERRPSSVAGLAVVLRAGSYYEPRGLEGVAHLAEHMLFRSNECMSSDEIEETVELSGGFANAYTSRDHMAVFSEVTAGALPRIAEVIECMLASRWVDEAEFESEKGVVLREIEGYRADDRSWILRLAMMAVYGPEAGRPIEGTPDSVARVSISDLIKFREEFFGAANAVAAIAGGVSRDEVAEVIKVLKRLPEGRRADARPPPPKPRDVREDRGSPTSQVAVAWLLPGLSELGDRAWDIDVALFNLGNGATSAMYSLLRRELGLVYSYNLVDSYELDRTAILLVAEDVAKDRVDEALAALEEGVWAKLAELVKDKSYLEGRRRFMRYLLRPERLSLADEALRLAVREAFGLEPLTYEDRVARLNAADWRFAEVPRLARARVKAILE